MAPVAHQQCQVMAKALLIVMLSSIAGGRHDARVRRGGHQARASGTEAEILGRLACRRAVALSGNAVMTKSSSLQAARRRREVMLLRRIEKAPRQRALSSAIYFAPFEEA